MSCTDGDKSTYWRHLSRSHCVAEGHVVVPPCHSHYLLIVAVVVLDGILTLVNCVCVLPFCVAKSPLVQDIDRGKAEYYVDNDVAVVRDSFFLLTPANWIADTCVLKSASVIQIHSIDLHGREN